MKILWEKVSVWLLSIAMVGFFVTRPAHSRPTANIDQPIDAPESMDIRGVYLLSNQITDLIERDQLEITRIIPNYKDAAVSGLSQRIEDVKWIPARGNADGKKGIVKVAWLVDPSGKIEFLMYTTEGDRELGEIVIQVARDYRFKPNERSRKYRFVTARYIFPAR
jgi:hypothetical protein